MGLYEDEEGNIRDTQDPPGPVVYYEIRTPSGDDSWLRLPDPDDEETTAFDSLADAADAMSRIAEDSVGRFAGLFIVRVTEERVGPNPVPPG